MLLKFLAYLLRPLILRHWRAVAFGRCKDGMHWADRFLFLRGICVYPDRIVSMKEEGEARDREHEATMRRLDAELRALQGVTPVTK